MCSGTERRSQEHNTKCIRSSPVGEGSNQFPLYLPVSESSLTERARGKTLLLSHFSEQYLTPAA